jgi:nucleoside permease NupC
MLTVAVFLYALIALVFLVETYLEGVRENADWDLWRVAGMGFCVVWPVLFLIAVPSALWPQALSSEFDSASRE